MASQPDREPDGEPGSFAQEDPPEDPHSPTSAIGARVDLDTPVERPEPQRDPAGPSQPREVPAASFWRRLGAYLIDSLLLTIPTNLAIEYAFGEPFPTDWGLAAPAEALDLLLPFAALAFAIELAYFTAFEASALQATLGKHVLGMQVADEEGQRLSPLRAAARNLAKLASALPVGLGFLMIFTSQRNQALHDHLASCLVLRRGEEQAGGRNVEDPGGGW